MKRREFITLLGGAAAAWPLAALAQQTGKLPLIGVLVSASPPHPFAAAFWRGLHALGYSEGRNIKVEFRYTDGRSDRAEEFAEEFVRLGVNVIVAHYAIATTAAMAATQTIPIVMVHGAPLQLGAIASLARPGGNVTGINYLVAEVTAKRLELLRALVPGAVQIAVLVNPEAPVTETVLRELEGAAATTGLRIRVLKARSSGEINAAFATFVHDRPDALFASGGFLFTSRRVQLVHLATRYAVPTAYSDREYVEAGGLMSYGTNLTESLQQVGRYTGRILKGARPADLPVMQSTKLELVINAETARMLSLAVPPTLLATADEVIE